MHFRPATEHTEVAESTLGAWRIMRSESCSFQGNTACAADVGAVEMKEDGSLCAERKGAPRRAPTHDPPGNTPPMPPAEESVTSW